MERENPQEATIRAFPTSPEDVMSFHNSWATRLWEDAGFPSSGSVHVVALKEVMTRVLQDCGVAMSHRIAADKIVEELQQGHRHWELVDFLRWSSTCGQPHHTSEPDGPRAAVNVLHDRRQSRRPQARRNINREVNPRVKHDFENTKIASAAKQSAAMTPIDWALCEVEAVRTSMDALCTQEAREKRVADLLAQVGADTRGGNRSDEDGLQHDATDHAGSSRTRIEEAICEAMQKQHAQLQLNAAESAASSSQAMMAALAHATEVRCKALMHAGAVNYASFQHPCWNSLRKVMEDAQRAGMST